MKSLNELMNLQGRVAVITGGFGHLGQAFAEALAELGAELVLVDMKDDHAKDFIKHLKSTYDAKVSHFLVDLEAEPEVLELAKKLQNWKQIDILINNAAFVGSAKIKGWATQFEQQLSETWRRALEVNLTAPFVLVQACMNMLKASGKGSVINVGSIYGMVGPNMSLYEGTTMGNPAAYAASKGGLLQTTRWMATVMAPEVRVNMITPGGVFRGQPEQFLQRYKQLTPLGRMAQEQDFKGIVAYLASDLSEYVTGQNFVVDGGWTCW